MPELRLTPPAARYYSRLFKEDDGFYTVLDAIRRLPLFAGRLEADGELLAFIEFLSGIFHIKWDNDVFDANHLRLIDILFGLQEAVDQNGDAEAKGIAERLVTRFQERFSLNEERLGHRVFSAEKALIARHQARIPEKDHLKNEVTFFLRASPAALVTLPEAFLDRTAPEWPPSRRAGFIIDPLDYAVRQADPVARRAALQAALNPSAGYSR